MSIFIIDIISILYYTYFHTKQSLTIKMSVRKKTKPRAETIREVSAYAEIANVEVDIDDLTHGNHQEFASLMAVFFEKEKKKRIKEAKNFQEVLNLLGKPEEFVKIVKIYGFKNNNKKGMYYCTTNRSIAAILIPSGGKNH